MPHLIPYALKTVAEKQQLRDAAKEISMPILTCPNCGSQDLRSAFRTGARLHWLRCRNCNQQIADQYHDH